MQVTTQRNLFKDLRSSARGPFILSMRTVPSTLHAGIKLTQFSHKPATRPIFQNAEHF